MSVMKQVWARAERNLRSQSGKNKTKNRAGIMTSTDFAYDMNQLAEDLTNRQLGQISERMGTTIRKEAVAMLKRGSNAGRVGESKYNKQTRGDWKNPRTSASGKEYLKGGWMGDVLSKRGANKPSMAYNGGSVSDSGKGRGNRGIITKNIRQRNGGIRSITGPRYSSDDSDNGKYGYNYAHVLEYGGKHVNWGGKNGQNSKALIARPFLGPAMTRSQTKNAQIINDMMRKWTKGQ